MSKLLLVGGFPASGKTSVTSRYVDMGYTRLNRDLVGGSVDDLLPACKAALTAGKPVVMDNLYATKASRAGALELGKKLGIPVSFVLMGTSLEDAQFNACSRMMEKVGHVLCPDEHKTNKDPNLFPVAVIYKYKKEFEKPTELEGFDSVTTEKFVRKYPKDWVNKAVIFDFDGTLRTHDGPEKFPTKPEQVRAYAKCTSKLNDLAKQGYLLLGASNQSGVAKGLLTNADAKACFDETLKQLGLAPGVKFEEVLYCPHKVPPITCYCRKPGSGMGVQLIYKYKLDPRQCIYVGDMTTDKSFAGRCGFKFVDHDEFFK
jgi:HAD superfamily hydrolase (TIGR01662 family)